MRIKPKYIRNGLFLCFISSIAAYCYFILESYLRNVIKPSDLKKYYLEQYFQIDFIWRNLLTIFFFFLVYSIISTIIFYLLRRFTKIKRIIITNLSPTAIHLLLMISTGFYDFSLLVIIIIYIFIWVHFISRNYFANLNSFK